MKKKVIKVIEFANEAEVEEYERRIREAHNQFVVEDPHVQENVDLPWWHRKAPGILKKVIPVFLPLRVNHKKT